MTGEDLTDDAFLDGRMRLWQPRAGYRAATDPLFLAAACGACPGQSVLDLGCGVGAAALALGLRVEGVSLFGLELQPAYAALARRNAARNGVVLDVVEGDAARMPDALRARSFDHVITNPPYFGADAGPPAADAGRDAAFRESLDLARWCDAGLRRVVSGGTFTLIHRAERLGEILAAIAPRCGMIRVLPLVPRAGRAAGRVIVSGRKGSNAPLRLGFPFIIHDGDRHERDEDDMTSAAQAVLRRGEAIDMAF